MGGAAGLATIVVMLMKQPRTPREWAVALISTVVSSVGGGAAIVMHFGLLAWADHYMGLVALFGLVFACGLPGWTVVRMIFNTAAKYQDKGVDDVYQDAKRLLP